MYKQLYNNDPIYRKKFDKELKQVREITNKKLAEHQKELIEKSKAEELLKKKYKLKKFKMN